MINLIEELSMNAWPALQTLLYDGWVLRFANGYTRRSNSINPLYTSTLDTAEKISNCEKVYAAQGQNVVFKMTSEAQPSDLDSLLAERGYSRQAPTSVRTLDLANVGNSENASATLDSELTDSWLVAFCRLNNVDSRHLTTMTAMLNSIIPAHCFCTITHNDEVAAVGLTVAERDYIGIFDIVTAANFRNQGFGTQLMLHLLNWGKANGAHTAYLQVMQENAPAIRLYSKLGFQEIYTYWYRVKDRSAVAAH